MEHMDVNIPSEKEEQSYFVKHPKGKVLGGLMEFWGFSLATIFAIILVGVIALDVVFGGVSFLFMTSIVIAFVIALLLFIGVKGRMMRSRAKRFNTYKEILAGREFCDIKELAEAVERSDEFVVKDLKQMIENRWFLQGHVDTQDKYLFLTDIMYEQYTLAVPKINM